MTAATPPTLLPTREGSQPQLQSPPPSTLCHMHINSQWPVPDHLVNCVHDSSNTTDTAPQQRTQPATVSKPPPTHISWPPTNRSFATTQIMPQHHICCCCYCAPALLQLFTCNNISHGWTRRRVACLARSLPRTVSTGCSLRVTYQQGTEQSWHVEFSEQCQRGNA
jgi:hypothetical protein